MGTMQDDVRKDVAYSPASETETEHKQADPLPDTLDDDIDTDAIRVVPGTGGPDDTGDVEIDAADDEAPRLQVAAEAEITRSLMEREARGT
jgi:hypothetical protein